MPEQKRDNVDEPTLRQLEVLSLFLDSDPAVIDSTPIEEVKADLWALGLEPYPFGIPFVDAVENSEKSATQSGAAIFEGKLIRKGLVVQCGTLRELLSRFLSIGGPEPWWVERICSNPMSIFKKFIGAQTAEEFLENNNFEDQIDLIIDMEIASEYRSTIDVSRVSIVAIYPSGALRTLPCGVTQRANSITVSINDNIVFLDPDREQLLSNIPSFWAQITVFAVEC